MTAAATARRWTAIVPVKPTSVGKSRLACAPEDRAELAQAIALDTIAAVAACVRVARVLVVTDDPAVGTLAGCLPRVEVVAEHGPRGIEAALALGAAVAGIRTRRVAVLADLPMLDPAELADLLERAQHVRRGVVADADSTGSTMITARTGEPWRSGFGQESLRRHRELGFTPFALPSTSSLRRDVDTLAHLRPLRDRAHETRTARALDRITLAAPEAAGAQSSARP